MQELTGLKDFFEANLELARPTSPISIFNIDETIVSRGHILPPSIIHDCTINNSLVGEGSVLVVSILQGPYTIHPQNQMTASSSTAYAGIDPQ